MKLQDLLTIIIPCKSDQYEILTCLRYLYNQNNIDGVRIILMDSSTKILSPHLLKHSVIKYKDKLNIDIIKNRKNKSNARLIASELCKTEYLLFLEADTCITDEKLLTTLLTSKHQKSLTTTTLVADNPMEWMYSILYPFQKILNFLNAPYASSNFQLWKTSAYWEAGGYNPYYNLADDFALTKNVNPTNFRIHKTKSVWVSGHILQKKGHWYLFKLLCLAYLNRKNPKFFKKYKI